MGADEPASAEAFGSADAEAPGRPVAPDDPDAPEPRGEPDLADAPEPRGELDLADAPEPGPPPTVVRAHDAWAEAGRTVLRVQLARMLGRVDGVIAGEDPEEVHAMRVAARRMRAAWRVFGDGFEGDQRRRYVDDLRAVGRRLGVVRDRDVLLELVAAHERRVGHREARALQPLIAAWRADRAAGHVVLVSMLRSPVFATFAEEYTALVGTAGAAARALDGPAHVRDRLPSRLWAAYEVVWAYDEGIDEADMVRLHALRIAGKWLRYTIEFARDALGPGSAALIAPVVDLQDHIGELHDLHVAAAEARAWLAGEAHAGAAERQAIERLATLADQRADRRRLRLGRTWTPLVSSDYRRRLGRALARL